METPQAVLDALDSEIVALQAARMSLTESEPGDRVRISERTASALRRHVSRIRKQFVAASRDGDLEEKRALLARAKDISLFLNTTRQNA